MNAITPRLDIKSLIAAIRRATGQLNGRVALLDPVLTDGDRADVFRTLGKEPFGYEALKAFETRLQEITGRRHAVAVASGTAALHLVLKALNIGEGHEVMVPAMTFAAAAAAVTYCGAQPHFIDCHFSPFGAINAFKLRQYLANLPVPAQKRIKAVIAVDLFGHPGIKPELRAVCTEFSLPLIEDAAGALGSQGFKMKCGENGIAAVISFNRNKIITTGGGGVVVTDDDTIAERVRSLATTAKIPDHWHYRHSEVGFNYRMPNICAAVGLSQLVRLDHIVASKRALRARYRTALQGSSFELVDEAEGCKSNAWLNAAMLAPHFNFRAEEHRDQTFRALHDAGIESRAAFTPLNRLPPYMHSPQQPDLGVANDIWRRTICLPSSVGAAA